MIELVHRYILPAAYAILPAKMNSPQATAFLLCVGLQESDFVARRQGGGGPAKSLWQFEKAGIRGVAQHPSSRDYLKAALASLQYSSSVGQTAQLHAIIEHNDVLAATMARLLLYTLPARLPGREDESVAFGQYLACWRPGKPRPLDWPQNYARAWDLVQPSTETV